MTKKFRPIWGEGNRPKPAVPRPAAGVASETADAESGGAGDDRAGALFALKAMFDRGLIDRDEYETRKSEIEAGRPVPDG